jgi:flagellar hook-associated protein FlgK
MSSFNLLNLGAQSLRANQAQLSTVGQNISNVNTDGYSRQRVIQTTLPDQTGVQVNGIERITSDFLTQQVWQDQSTYNQTQTFSALADQLDNLLATSTTSVSTAMDQYFSALQNVVDDPVSIPNRQLFVAQADALVERFNALDANITRQSEQVNSQLDSYTSEVNTIASRIADLNDKIRIATAGNNPANELKDQRDQLTNELSEIIGIKVINQSSEQYSIFVGNGQPLVVGQSANQLIAAPGDPDPSQLEVNLVIAGTPTTITDELVGGTLGGLLQYREEVLNGARNELGLIALGFAESMNEQHRSGIDLNNDMGENLFNDINALSAQFNRIAANSANQSNLTSARVEISDISKLQASDYDLVYNGPDNITLIRKSDGQQFDIDNLTPSTDDRTITAATAAMWQGNGVTAGGVSENLDYNLNGAGVTGSPVTVTSAREATSFLNGIPGVDSVTATTAARISNLTEVGGNSGGDTTFTLNVLDDSGASQALAVTVPLVGGSPVAGGTMQAAIQQAMQANGGSFSNISLASSGNDITITDSSGGNIQMTLTDTGDTASFSALNSGGTVAGTANLTAGGSATSVVTGYISDAEADKNVTSLALTPSGGTLLNGSAATLVTAANNVASTLDDTVQGIADVSDGEFYLDPDAEVLAFSIDGMKVVIETSTKLTQGDRFLLQPTRNGADELNFLLQDGRKLALASPVRITADSANQGNGVATVAVTDSSAAAFATQGELRPPLDVVFNNTDPLTYTVYDITDPNNPQVYNPGNGALQNQAFSVGGSIQVDGYKITIENTPKAGDRFRFEFNKDGFSDNRNALTISNLQNAKLLDGGSYQDVYGGLVEEVGTRTATARIASQANKSVLDSAISAKASVSGVNLDEEAAKLVQYQQAYQASSQLIRVSQTLFDSLLSSF